MRHDEERPRTSGFLADGMVPGHWTQVLGTMRANPFTHLSLEEVRAEAAHLLIVAPSPEVARACFGEMLDAFGDSIEIAAAEGLVPNRVPAGTWVFLPHRQDGWTELENASATLRAALVKENSSRESGSKLVLMEYGINLWMWAEPPSSGGDPVCHAGELISWESAWTLGASECEDGEDSSRPKTSPPAVSSGTPRPALVRPPIYFGLPPVLRRRRWDS
ncbi:hypothetical protein D3I60_18345 [Brevibacterium permense]|uniref:hypothetical protein n=1 Tax=Brevibacterium permense TaxID=234834 RepID=UPI0021D0D811|nr:hypothetical protein [Brevibacterium permense]MCU4299010.1 hypothetical protein [Brevibacterium permense]